MSWPSATAPAYCCIIGQECAEGDFNCGDGEERREKKMVKSSSLPNMKAALCTRIIFSPRLSIWLNRWAAMIIMSSCQRSATHAGISVISTILKRHGIAGSASPLPTMRRIFCLVSPKSIAASIMDHWSSRTTPSFTLNSKTSPQPDLEEKPEKRFHGHQWCSPRHLQLSQACPVFAENILVGTET